MIFKKIILENFQSHAYTEIVLNEGLNVIIGESDRGKSAVIRALNWLIYNEPRGADFIRAGERHCRVTVQLDDGTTVLRERTPSLNRYIVDRPGSDPQVYEGFGTKVPVEVAETLGVFRVALDDDLEVPLNISKQLDPPFLISESGSVKSKSIGRLYNVHIIDAAVRDTAKDLSDLQKENRRLELEIRGTDEELCEFEDLPDWEKRLAKAELLLKRYDELKAQHQRMLHLSERLRSVQTDALRQKMVIRSLGGIRDVRQLIRSLEFVVKRRNTLWQLSEKLKLHSGAITKSLFTIDATKNLSPSINKAIRAKETLDNCLRLKTLAIKLSSIGEEKSAEKNRVAATEGVVAALQKIDRIDDSLKKSSELGLLGSRLGFVYKKKKAVCSVLDKTVELGLAGIKLEDCNKQERRLIELKNYLGSLKDVKSRIGRGKKYVAERDQYIVTGLKKYETVLRSMGRCPVCLSEVDSRTIERIITEFGGAKDGKL